MMNIGKRYKHGLLLISCLSLLMGCAADGVSQIGDTALDAANPKSLSIKRPAKKDSAANTEPSDSTQGDSSQTDSASGTGTASGTASTAVAADELLSGTAVEKLLQHELHYTRNQWTNRHWTDSSSEPHPMVSASDIATKIKTFDFLNGPQLQLEHADDYPLRTQAEKEYFETNKKNTLIWRSPSYNPQFFYASDPPLRMVNFQGKRTLVISRMGLNIRLDSLQFSPAERAGQMISRFVVPTLYNGSFPFLVANYAQVEQVALIFAYDVILPNDAPNAHTSSLDPSAKISSEALAFVYTFQDRWDMRYPSPFVADSLSLQDFVRHSQTFISSVNQGYFSPDVYKLEPVL